MEKLEKIYCINLEKRQDRRQHMEQQFQRSNITNYEFVKGYDGEWLPKSIRWGMGANYYGEKCRNKLACLFSHLETYMKIIKNNHKYAVVLEDDVYLCKDFEIRLNYLINNYLPPDWDLVFLDNPIGFRNLYSRFEWTNPYTLRVTRAHGNSAMLLNTQFLKNLVPRMQRLENYNDVIKNRESFNFRYYLFLPTLAYSQEMYSDNDPNPGKDKKLYHFTDLGFEDKWDYSKDSLELKIKKDQEALEKGKKPSPANNDYAPKVEKPSKKSKKVRKKLNSTEGGWTNLNYNDIDKIYYINLDFRTDRKNEMEKELKRVDIEAERFPAIYGDKFRPKIPARNYGVITNYQLATLVTHKRVMCKALEDGCNIAMMLEDDIEFCDDFKERLSNIKIPNDWDCLLLSYTCNSNFPGFEWITPNVAKAQRVDGLHTYIMKRNFMETFYERYRKQNPMAPNDHIIHLLMPDFNIYLLFPFFTKQRNGYSDNKQLGREDLNSKYPHFRNYLKDWNNSDYSKGSKG